MSKFYENLDEAIKNKDDCKKLYLDNNQLTSLPEEIGNCTNIKELGLYDNKFETLPEKQKQDLREKLPDCCIIYW